MIEVENELQMSFKNAYKIQLESCLALVTYCSSWFQLPTLFFDFRNGFFESQNILLQFLKETVHHYYLHGGPVCNVLNRTLCFVCCYCCWCPRILLDISPFSSILEHDFIGIVHFLLTRFQILFVVNNISCTAQSVEKRHTFCQVSVFHPARH